MIDRGKWALAGCLACVGCLVLIVALAYEVASFERLDTEALSRLSTPTGSASAGVADFVMHLADPLPLLAMLAVVCLLALHWGRPRQAMAAFVLVAGANLTTQVLKAVLAHPRYQPVLGYRQIDSTSFPSGHATASLSIALAVVLAAPRSHRLLAAIVGVAFAFCVGLSVLVLNRHFPSDVLGGWLVAGAWFFAVLASPLRGRTDGAQRSGRRRPLPGASGGR